jgi:hypothetical protein
MMTMFFLGMLTMAAIDLLTVVAFRRKFRDALDILIAGTRA